MAGSVAGDKVLGHWLHFHRMAPVVLEKDPVIDLAVAAQRRHAKPEDVTFASSIADVLKPGTHLKKVADLDDHVRGNLASKDS